MLYQGRLFSSCFQLSKTSLNKAADKLGMKVHIIKIGENKSLRILSKSFFFRVFMSDEHMIRCRVASNSAYLLVDGHLIVISPLIGDFSGMIFGSAFLASIAVLSWDPFLERSTTTSPCLSSASAFTILNKPVCSEWLPLLQTTEPYYSRQSAGRFQRFCRNGRPLPKDS